MMTKLEESTRQVHSALYVDFDNIYINFAQMDNHLAYQFATKPDRWLEWLEKQMTTQYLGPSSAPRRILIRRCYLNPQTFAEFRPYFIRAAFEVIDCPPLTSHGKTSADIHMVIDILDALHHSTFFTEFIILSADADFSPAMVRLRRFSRYTAILPVGFVSPACKASSDYLIPLDLFIREALEISHSEEDASPPPPPDREATQASSELLGRLAERLYSAAILPSGIEASDLPAIYREFADFKRGAHWFGFYSLRRLTEAVVAQRPDLRITDEDPWRVVRAIYNGHGGAVNRPPTDRASVQGMQQAVAEWIRSVVHESKAAVPMASLAQALQQRFGVTLSQSEWLGAGSFKDLLARLDLGEARIANVLPGYVYDPARHAMPEEDNDAEDRSLSEPLDNFSLRYPDLAPLARKVHQLTETPYLMPEHYALLLREIARAINEHGYHLTHTSKMVRDRCVERGAPVSRAQVNFVLIGISYTGYRFGENLPEDSLKLGEALVQNTLTLCNTAQLNLSEADTEGIRTWILSNLKEDAA